MKETVWNGKCFIYAINNLADWEIAYITSELNSGRFLKKSQHKVQVIWIGNDARPVKTMGGITILPEMTIKDVRFQENDLLILPGSDTWHEKVNEEIISIVPDLIRSNVTVAAICGSTAALAGKGVFIGRRHTSNDREYLITCAPEYSDENMYVEKPAVTDGNLITASGTASLEFAYEIFKKTGVMNDNTANAWYGLYKTGEKKYFMELMQSL